MPYQDRVDHATVLFNHLDRLGKEVNELFKKELKEGNLAGPLASSKIQNFFVSVQWLETLLIPYLGKQYDDRRKLLKANFANAWNGKDWLVCFTAINEQAQILVLEAYSQGFMLKQTVSGDYVIDQSKAELEDSGEEDSTEPEAPQA